MGRIILLAIVAYVAYAIYLSVDNQALSLPFKNDWPNVNMASPGSIADGFYTLYVENSGFKAVAHPDTLRERKLLLQQFVSVSDDTIRATAKEWSSRYGNNGSLTQVLNSAVNDPFDSMHIKFRVLTRLNSLNIK